jgi:hypothetical protein
LSVAGWVKTRRFEFWLGDGQNAAANLSYSLSSVKKQFTVSVLGSVKTITGRLKVDTSDLSGLPVEVRTNGVLSETFIGGGVYIYNGLGDGQMIVLTAPPRVSIERSNSIVSLSWSAGVLLEAANLEGPWTTNTAAVSPQTIFPTNTHRFYRVRVD